MSDEHEEQVEGITFWFANSTLAAPARPTDVFSVSLTLTGGVQSEELWKDILDRLKSKNGFRVFSSNDFHIEVMHVMRVSIRELEDKNTLLTQELTQKKDELRLTQEALAAYQQPLSALGKALRGEPQDGVHWTEGADHERSPVERSDAGQGR